MSLSDFLKSHFFKGGKFHQNKHTNKQTNYPNIQCEKIIDTENNSQYDSHHHFVKKILIIHIYYIN